MSTRRGLLGFVGGAAAATAALPAAAKATGLHPDADLLAAIARAEKEDSGIRAANASLNLINARLAMLTPREREVMTHVIAGRLNKQIAGDLGTVEKTVKVHRGRVMIKLGVRSVADLVRLAERAGITRNGS